MRAFFVAFALTCAAACTPPASQSPASATESGGIETHAAWAAPTPGGVDVSAGYLTLRNTGVETDRLLGAESPRAGRVEVHDMIMDGAVMRMRRAESLVLDPGEEVLLAPGGQHLMFYQLSEPFTEGQEIPVRLRFERAGDVDVSLQVRRPTLEHAPH